MEKSFDVVSFIQNFGFAAAVATYALVVLNKTLKENTKMLNAIYMKITGEVPKDGGQ